MKGLHPASCAFFYLHFSLMAECLAFCFFNSFKGDMILANPWSGPPLLRALHITKIYNEELVISSLPPLLPQPTWT